MDLNEALMEAIAYYQVDKVRKCLEDGADANYTLFKDEDEPNGYIQPTTPLRLVMFRISDTLLGDDELLLFLEIAKLLLKYGADPKPAIQLAEGRYGKYTDEGERNPFMQVWEIVEKAGSKH